MDDNVSHVEGSTTVMSAGESESESDEQEAPEADVPETPYIYTPEDEFGAVSLIAVQSFESLLNFSVISRLANKSRNLLKSTRA